MKIFPFVACFCPGVFTLSLLTSCVSFKAQPLSAEAGNAAFESRSLNDAGLRRFLSAHHVPQGKWNLDSLAMAAVYFHPDVAVARAEADEAAAAIETAAQRPNPVLTFSPQFASNMVGVTPWFIAQNLAIPFETAGKRSRRTEQALATAEAARWRVSSRAWLARSRVRTALLEWHGARGNIRLLEAEQNLHNDAIQKLTAQIEAGDVSPFELTQSRLALNRTRLALQDAQRTAASSEAKLAAAVGVPLSAIRGVRVDTDLNLLPAVAEKTMRRKALTQRADLMALLADYAAAESGLRVEIAKQYPDLRLSPGYDYNQGQNRWQLGLNFELPLNRNRGGIAQADAKRQTVAARFLAQQSQVQGELDIALATYQASRTKAATAATLAKEAGTAVDTTRQMVSAGQVSQLEVTRRQLEASAANIALMTATMEAQMAAGTLEDAAQATLR